MLTTHLHLVPGSGMSRSYTSIHPWHLHSGSWTAFSVIEVWSLIHLILSTHAMSGQGDIIRHFLEMLEDPNFQIHTSPLM
jgi:hypothetical protein